MSDGWTDAALGEVAEIAIGRTPPRDEARYWTNDLTRPFCTIADMDGGTILPRREGITEAAEVDGKAKRMPAGSLLLSFKLTIGRVGIAGVDLFPNEAIARVEPRTASLDKRYLALWLSSADLLSGAGRAVKGNTLNSASLRAIPVSYPPLAEQRRIVDLIGAVEASVEAADAVRLRTREAANRMRDEWFSGALPDAVAVQDAVEVTNGRLRNPANASGPYMTRYVRAANVQDGELVMDTPMHMNFTPKEQERYRLRPGDTLVTEGSGSRTSIGASCRWNGEVDGVVCFQNHLLRLRPRLASGVEPAFVYQWALWSHRTGRFADIATGTNILSLGVGRVMTMPFPLANPARRLNFVASMEASDAQERAAERVARAARLVRNSVLGDLLTGEHQIPASYDRFLDGAA